MSNYDAYGKWAMLYYEFIFDKLKVYTEKIKHLLTVQLGIVGGFVVFIISKGVASDCLSRCFLTASSLSFIGSIVLSIIGLSKTDAVTIGIPTPPQQFKEDDETEDYVWADINSLSKELLRHNNSKFKLYRYSLLFFSIGLGFALFFFFGAFIS